MRKFFLIALSLVLVSALRAEDERHSFGLQVGFAEPILRLNSPTVMGQSASYLDKTVLNGFKVGVVYDGVIIKGFGVSMGVNYTFAAARSSWNSYDYTPAGVKTLLPQIEYSTDYVYNQGEIFVDWQYKFEIAKHTFFIVYTGPTIQYGGYRATDMFRDINTGSTIPLNTVVWSYADRQDEYLRHLNVTWGVGAGFQYQLFFLRGGYDFGIINPYKKESFGDLDVLYTEDGRWTRGRLDQWQIKIGMYLFRMN